MVSWSHGVSSHCVGGGLVMRCRIEVVCAYLHGYPTKASWYVLGPSHIPFGRGGGKKITEKKISRVLEENVPEVREWEAVV